ncbi:hypothetical protein BV898_15673 [Hypsibius exemplaris]|uniref:ZSWIM1/3 RNaseH-like domain-containing protein n=1 Tax=Hypsibius exemplaris TaxID=2072580 RepID=A0A9X6NBK1_HYPEX|nr:hypothetical protein BV898_15673 [Hypsibius exemplaris]
MDGTYNLTAERYPLYVLAVQDNSGYTRPVAVAFVGRDSAAIVKTALGLFKSCHTEEQTARTAIVFIDKDKKEISALEEEFPHAAILLCWFLVMKAMKSAIAELNIDKPTKENIFRQC